MHHYNAPHLLEIDHLLKAENRIVTYDDIPGEIEYVTNTIPTNERSICYSGQRKLLFGEIQFLTKNLSLLPDDKVVIYIGSAPGYHLISLIKLFPYVKFILYDGRRHARLLYNFVRGNKLIKINRALYTRKESLKYANVPHLLISDIRNLRIGKIVITEYEDNPEHMNEKFAIIDNDLNLQKEIILMSQPIASMLKFVVRWNDGVTNYLDGTVYVQSWAKRGSAETRLVCKQPYTFRDYSNKEYEQKLAYYNKLCRTKYYDYTDEMNQYILDAGGDLDDEIPF